VLTDRGEQTGIKQYDLRQCSPLQVDLQNRLTHVMKLIVEGRLRQERGKLVVVGSEWIEPTKLSVQPRFDF
jgi:hypothetical protein